MNFIGNRNFRAGPQTSLEGFICHQNSDKQQKIKVFGRSGGYFYEVYLVQGATLLVCRECFSNDLLFVLLGLLVTVLVAKGMSIVNGRIIRSISD